MRYKRWVERGVLWKVLMRLQKAHVLEVKVAFMDSTVVRAHRHIAGSHKKGSQALGRSKGGFGTKLHLAWRPLRTIVGRIFVGGQVSDHTYAPVLAIKAARHGMEMVVGIKEMIVVLFVNPHDLIKWNL